MRGQRSSPFYLTRPSPPVAPVATRAEAFYYEKQIESRTAHVLVLDSGARLRGRLVDHDVESVAVVLMDGREIRLAKEQLSYLFKAEVGGGPRRRGRSAR